jgi:hypothetical protein
MTYSTITIKAYSAIILQRKKTCKNITSKSSFYCHIHSLFIQEKKAGKNCTLTWPFVLKACH